MSLPLVFALTLGQTAPQEQPAPPNPYQLSLGRSGRVHVAENALVDTRTGRAATMDDVAKAARNYRFVFLGESHDNPHHHQRQAEAIAALAKDGRNVIVGFEMFTRPNQPNLAPWSMGYWTEEQFIQRADWKTQWGFDFALYRPIFDVVKANKLPMVALNVPRDWVRTISRQGPDALPAEAKSIPLDLSQSGHKQVFQALMGGHPMGGQMDNVYRGQVLWDEGMADTAIQYLATRYGTVEKTPRQTVFVIVAGIGHGMYGQGINLRLKKRTSFDCLNFSPVEGAMDVSRGLGDFVYASPPVKRD